MELGFNIEPPFASKIMEEPLPSRFKMPQLEPYDGTADLVDHLKSFKALILLYGITDAIPITDAILYQAFPLTLRKVACHWYSSFQLDIVSSFNQLNRMFFGYFVSSQWQHQNLDFLISIKQQKNDSLWDYINCFNATTLKVWYLDESVAMIALKAKLLQNDLLFLLKKYPKDFIEMLEQAKKYAHVEEA